MSELVDQCKTTIIIASLNVDNTLQDCINSIANQNWHNKEIIIIDGGSSDGSLQIIKNNQSFITYWESSPDRGIYHAWNKAIPKAKGDYLCFLGADDCFADNNSLETLARSAIDNGFPDFVSAKVAIKSKTGKTEKIVGEIWNPKKLKKWMIVAHPGMLHHKNTFHSFGTFSEEYKIAGDYDFLLRCNNKTRSVFVDKVIVNMGYGGLSEKNKKMVFNETFTIQAKNEEIGIIRAFYNYCISWIKSYARKFLESK